MIPDRSRQRQRPWDQVSWWYSLLLVVPLIGFVATFLWSSSAEDDRLSGVVRDAFTGDPLSGAIVSTANATATTDGDGSFSVDDLSATSLTISREDYASTQVAVGEQGSRLDVTLRPTTIRGIVRNEKTGDAMPGITVTLTGPDGQSRSVVTNDDGEYVIDNVPDSGTVAVVFEGVTVGSRQLGTDPELDFEIRPDVLTGRITGPDGQPVAGAEVTIGEARAETDIDGTYRIPAVPEEGTITVRKPGFVDLIAELPESLVFDAQLEESRVRAIYASAHTTASDELWADMIEIADDTVVNALVVDLKDSTGHVFYDSEVPMVEEIGAEAIMFDVEERLEEMRDKGIYSIARIVVFEDPLLAEQRPDLAIHDVTTGGLWTTWDGLAWVNAHEREVWEYNIAIATEAARLGFDEIQLDYIRFPSDGLLENADYGAEYANETRLEAITTFLGQMDTALEPTGAYLAVDIFGLTMWDDDDGGIGQSFVAIAPYVDVVCPMIYPSHFYPGELGLDIPNNHPYEVILWSLQSGAEKLPEAAHKLRPWLQDFSYGEGIEYGDAEVAAQIQAAEEFGGNGWMIWSPSNVYHTGGIAAE